MLRSNSGSSTLRNDSRKRTYIITTSRMTSGEELNLLNGLSGLQRNGINPLYPGLNVRQSGTVSRTMPP
ncbi:hypothetical protein [Erythrobacter sp.]|uniref:hypothetical protein n=1 Tax=Erythrobacter sp. TaxID=1042 RepID=UPI003296C573